MTIAGDLGLTARLASRLIGEEGKENRVYRDTNGFWTAGVGHLLSDAEYRQWKDMVIPEAQILQWLYADIAELFPQLDRYFPWWRTLTAPRQLVILDMCFNLGIGKLSKFTTSMPLIQAGRYREAATALSKTLWDKQVGARADRLQQILVTGQDDLYYYGKSPKGN